MSYVTQHWSFDPMLVLVGVIVVLHELGLRALAKRSRAKRSRERRRRSVLFYAGLATLLLAIVSPIDFWADDYFFIHMIAHLMIMFFAPILIVSGAPWLPLVHGLPVRIRRVLLRQVLMARWSRPLRWLGRIMTNGWFDVILLNVVMVFWHLPVAFNLAANNQAVHIWLMHGSFFVAGVFFWMQIIPSHPVKPRLSTGAQIGAILLTNVVMIILAMALSIMSTSSWYPSYSGISGVTFSPFADQQIGAAILWVCGDFWALPALMLLVRRAISEEGSASAFADRLLRRAVDTASGDLRHA